ncbi:MAG: zinc metallopeptidase [Sandaracinaceae bacterium]|nr:zinc metallopeptidase [Sandaracinaceae bacterium]
MFFDPLYFVILAPAMLLSAWAAWSTRSRFAEWSDVPTATGMSGAEVARYLLDRFGLSHIRVVPHEGILSDHYDPKEKEVRLSESVFYDRSISAIAVAAHEVGHAIQDKEQYAPLALRNAAVPVASFGSNVSFILIAIGFAIASVQLIWLGILFFSAVVLFQIITLPVEFDASRRAKEALAKLGIVTDRREAEGVSKVLNAAAMTYVGAALTSVLTLLYYLIRLGVFSGGRNEEE